MFRFGSEADIPRRVELGLHLGAKRTLDVRFLSPNRSCASECPVPGSKLTTKTNNHPTDLEHVLAVYRHALAALSIRHIEIRRDYLAGVWIEAVTDFKAEGLAEADAEKRADALIEEVFAAMEHGQAWLRQRIAVAERA